MVINESVRIDWSAITLQKVTISEKITGKSAGDPTLADGIIIGTGAIVIGNVVLGVCSIVGAGRLVMKDVPAYALAANDSAKVIKGNVEGRV